MQHQNNYDDCGVYAIAFLVSLPHCLNRSNLTFDRKLIRQHSLKSLGSGSFVRFPLSKVSECRDGRPLFVQEVSVMCKCRMPREESDSKSPLCVKCCSCKEFFHRKRISTIILEDLSAKWRCPNCERALKREEENNH